jgi:hypothetical protein
MSAPDATATLPAKIKFDVSRSTTLPMPPPGKRQVTLAALHTQAGPVALRRVPRIVHVSLSADRR